MQANKLKNIVILKNLPSNIVEEAIVILKSNKYAKKLQMIEKKFSMLFLIIMKKTKILLLKFTIYHSNLTYQTSKHVNLIQF